MSARDLLAAATPRPWFVVGLPWNPHAPWINAESEDPHGGSFVCDLDADEPNENAVGDAALIVAAVNEYEALLAIAEAAPMIGNAFGCYGGCTGGLSGAPPDGSGHTPGCRALRDALAAFDTTRSTSRAAGTPTKSAPTAPTERNHR